MSEEKSHRGPPPVGFDTLTLHAGQVPDPTTGARATPIYQSASFVFPDSDYAAGLFNIERAGHVYSRLSNPTNAVLEERMAALDQGVGSIVTASGQAAMHLAVATILSAGDHIVSSRSLYGGTHNLLEYTLTRFGIETTFVDTADPDAVRAAIRPNTKIIYFETIANPTMKVAAIPPLVEIAKEHDIILICDNTFASPWVMRPLEWGVDIVVESATKFIGGHSDLLAGVAVASNDEVAAGLRRSRTLQGASPGALETFLALRGARTLAVRLRQAEATALVLAERLSVADWVSTVRYPGLPGDPFHDVAKKVLNGFGSMLSFDLVGDAATADEFLDRLELIQVVTSLGGVESTIERRAKLAGQEHLPPTLLRLSVGIEHADDLWADVIGAAVVLTR